ncbi:MAG: CmcI family methyltransferase [Pseudomonadota bacterium]
MIEIDEDAGTVSISRDGTKTTYPLGSPEGFSIVSRAWLRAGWDAKHVYTFSWLGRPIIQLPEDMIRMQETIDRIRPDVILETGIAHGGSAVFFASVMKLLGKGRVVSVDIEIRDHNRKALETHPLKPLITLIEGDSVAPETVARVRDEIGDAETVLVILDSNHSREHVAAELEAYADLVSVGSYCIVCDGIMADVVGAPRSEPDWHTNNPVTATRAFLEKHPEFRLERPTFAFNESTLTDPVTYWPHSHLLRTA